MSAGSGGADGTGLGGAFDGSGGAFDGSGSGGHGAWPSVDCQPHSQIYDGFESCDGYLRRHEPKVCQVALPREVSWTPKPEDSCQSDEDCTERPYGLCEPGGLLAHYPRVCVYGCAEDADCGTGYICVCGPDIGSCSPATCTSDADCGEGLECASYNGGGAQGCPLRGFACQTSADECRSKDDCATYCDLDSDGVRRCSSMPCLNVAGRPFLVAEAARLASPSVRDDWKIGTLDVELSSLTLGERRGLSEAWLSNALMEHASIAAFARFTLELLAVGAPADLIRDSSSAALDETRHAEQCFALASHYAGESLGPGLLAVDGALDGVSLEKLVVTAIAEGCIGETIAAIEAAEQQAHATEPAVREVLAGISEDETRHAELAWRFVAWALERDPSLRSVAKREFERHVSAPCRVVKESELDLGRYGVLSGRARSALRRTVLDGVIRNCASALLARGGSVGLVRDGSSLERTA